MPKIFLCLTILTAIAVLFIFSCAPGTAPETGLKESPVLAPAAPEKVTAEQEWEKVLAKAKKEGQVTLYGAFGLAQAREPFIKAVKEKFGISLDATIAQPAELVARVTNERRAGLYLPDIFMGGTQSLAISLIPQKVFEPVEPHLILPEVKDPSKWFLGRLPVWGDERQVFASLANITSFIAINNTLIKPEELVSFRDLLKPRLKGMIIMADPTRPGFNWFPSANLLVGTDFLRDLVSQDIVVTRDLRLIQDSLMKGKYLVGIGVDSAGIRAAIRDGAPLSMLPVFKEGTVIVVGAGNVVVFNNTPHPNAVKVFVNWVLSKEGQTLFSKISGMASRRLDVPTDHLEPWMVPDPNRKYLWETDEDYMKAQGRNFELAREIFGPLLQ